MLEYLSDTGNTLVLMRAEIAAPEELRDGHNTSPYCHNPHVPKVIQLCCRMDRLGMLLSTCREKPADHAWTGVDSLG